MGSGNVVSVAYELHKNRFGQVPDIRVAVPSEVDGVKSGSV